MADLQHDLEVDRAAAFSILMAHGRGISSKSPDYMMGKWRGIQQCRNQIEVTSFLDVFGQRIFYKWRDAWFKETHADFWPYVLIPPDGSDSSTTNKGGKQEVRMIECHEHASDGTYFCYVQDDGSHVKAHICTCGTFPKEDCVVDLHRLAAIKRATTGDWMIGDGP